MAKARAIRSTGLTLTLGFLVHTQAARADERPSLLADHQSAALPAVLELDVGVAAHGTDTAVVSVLEGRYAASRSVQLEGALPFIWLDSEMSGARDGSHTGNLYLAAYYIDAEDTYDEEPGYLRLGAGLSFPTSSLDDDAALGDVDGTGLITAMRGGVSAWLYQPEAFGIVLPVEAESQSGRLVLGSELTLAIVATEAAFLAALQLVPMVAVRTGIFMLGSRLQVVWVPFGGDDAGLLSVVPFAQLDLSDSFVVDARFVLNLDEPLGVFGGAGVWGAFAGAGWRVW